MEEQDTKRSQPLSFLRIVVIIVASAMFLYAGYQLFEYWRENTISKQSVNDLASQAVTVLTPVEPPETQPPETTPAADPEASEPAQAPTEPDLSGTIPLLVDFDVLQSENADIIGWIYSEDTPINYPVVQAEDNQYYLQRLPNKKHNGSGSIFMDFRNSPDLSDLNSIVYGHNMTNDTMFGSLVDYKRQNYYDDHKQLWILTKERAYRIDVIAGIVTRSDSDTYTIFETPEELQDHLAYCVEKSTFKSDYNLESVERIITLSTCSYEYNTARYVIIGNLVPIEYAAE